MIFPIQTVFREARPEALYSENPEGVGMLGITRTIICQKNLGEKITNLKSSAEDVSTSYITNYCLAVK
jgi:hypothetical protein